MILVVMNTEVWDMGEKDEKKDEKKLVDLSVREFTEEVASRSPAPGGGSVAAMGCATAAALVSMVCNLSIGKEKYKENEPILLATRARVTKLMNRLLDLVDEDTTAFNMVMSAYRLPKDTKDRDKQIEDALKKAAEVPFETCKIAREVAELATIVAEKGNQNSITDAGMAVLMADAAFQGAELNVRINLKWMKDEKFKEEIEEKLQKLEYDMVEIVEKGMYTVLRVVDPEAFEQTGDENEN